MKARIKTAILLLVPALAFAQAPVDDEGNVIGSFEPQADVAPLDDTGLPPLSQDELEELIGPVALYPDDLLAIVLPAAAYPLQIVEAARFLEAVESDPSLKPDPDWDDSVVALTNYPEVVELLNSDLDWTLRLGEAVVTQQGDVVAAIESFRDRAYAAGNLKSDSYQNVSVEDDVIQITPVAEDAIYVPYYEPEQVVVYQPRPVYYYYPRPYPVYYYPYSAGHHFYHDHFWGVTTAFTIGWFSDSLHVYHHSYYGHPYYGRSYWDSWWYRRPSINIYNTTYLSRNHVTVNRYRHGDRWRPSERRREYVLREGYTRDIKRRRSSSNGDYRDTAYRQQVRNEPISFRERGTRTTNTRMQRSRRADTSAENSRRAGSRSDRTASQRDRAVQPAALADSRQPRSKDFSFRNRETNRQQVPSRNQRSTVQKQPRESVQRQRDAAETKRTMMARSERSQARTQRAPAQAQQRAPVRTQRAAPQVQQRAPARTQRAAPQVQQHAPARTQRAAPQVQQSAPARQQTRQAESRRPAEQAKSRPSRSSADKPSRQTRSSSGSRSRKRER